MFASQIHLALNHFPIAGIILSVPILLWGLLAKKDQVKSVGIAVVIVAALSAIAVFATGEGTEDAVKTKPGVTKHLIHEHEEAAEAAMVVIQICAVLSIIYVVLNQKNNPLSDKVFIGIIIMAFIGSGLIAKAAHEGGLIRHDELREK